MDTGVYLIENLANGRRYVGSANSLKKRFREHRRQLSEGRHHSRFLQRAWNKYGPLFFRFRVVAYCSRDDLLFYEQRLIDGLKPDYNTSPTAGSQLGYRHTEETRRKMSVARRRNPSSPRKGMRHTPETLAKLSESRKGKGTGARPEEVRLKVAASMRAAKNCLSDDQVRRVRSLRAHGMQAKQVAAEIGCTYHVVYDIGRNRCYGWVK